MENKRISCKGNAADIPACEYDSAWLCKHPKCKSIVLTSTMYGARPRGCPKIEEWNRRMEDKTCATCIDNDNGLCDRKGILIQEDDTCDCHREDWQQQIGTHSRHHHRHQIQEPTAL